jgi:hypothetical protein
VNSLEKTLLLTIEKEFNNLEKFYKNFKMNWNQSIFYNEITSEDWVDREIYKIAITNFPLLLNKIIERSISLEICLRALRDKTENE